MEPKNLLKELQVIIEHHSAMFKRKQLLLFSGNKQILKLALVNLFSGSAVF